MLFVESPHKIVILRLAPIDGSTYRCICWDPLIKAELKSVAMPIRKDELCFDESKEFANVLADSSSYSKTIEQAQEWLKQVEIDEANGYRRRLIVPKEERTRIIESISSGLPVFYAVISLIGYLNYHTLYSGYGISINNYLSIGELVLAFMQVIVPVIAILGIVFLEFLVAFGHLTVVGAFAYPLLRYEDSLDEKENLSHDMDSYEWKWLSFSFHNRILQRKGPIWVVELAFSWLWYVLKVVVFSAVGLFILKLLGTIFSFDEMRVRIPWTLFAIAGICCMVLTSGAIIAESSRTKRYTRSVAYYLAVLNSLTIFTFLVVAKNRYLYHGKMSGEYVQEARIVTGNDTIRTNECLLYVGRIDAGVFLFDLAENKSRMIPTSEIKEVELERFELEP